MYKDKSDEELLTILTEVCDELRTRSVGLADVGGNVEPIISVKGQNIMTVHVDSTLGVSVMRDSLSNYKVNMFEEGRNLSEERKQRFGVIKHHSNGNQTSEDQKD